MMPPKGIRTQFIEKKKAMDAMNTKIGMINQENTSPGGNSSQQSVQKSRKRIRVQKSEELSTPQTNMPKRRKLNADQKVELTINSSTTENEGLDFGVEGLYPAKNGQLLNKRYKIDEMLGVGGFATVHMAMDKKTKTNVALKIVRCGQWYNDVSDQEIEFMRTARDASDAESDSHSSSGSKYIVSLLDSFRIKGACGIHVVMVTEMLGPNLYSVLVESNQNVLSFHRIQRFSQNILQGLHFLHSKCGIMHLDLKPDNIMVRVDPENMDLNNPKCSASVKIGDFGTSDYITENVRRTVQTCNYRAPEAFLKAKITPAVDIWSFGCTLYEMATRQLLFKCNDSENCSRVFHMNCISSSLGPIRKSLFKKDMENEFILEMVFGEKKVLTRTPGSTNFIRPEELKKRRPKEDQHAQACSQFLRELMKIDPKKRLTAEQALKHFF
ncbi:hypothetical protein CAEBREN_05570 [Caenorhabditis brenneri]|uniref:non-specific serine/threonine protein kinase n=1 Tax=Caenorhabditis brenneri TaxID=135651 RepID=G0NGL7_CAEBE|nr:hypothetical protein CAEBREN_05570 [Caenorhabditis brenneri]